MQPLRRHTVPTALAVVVAVLLAGCGGHANSSREGGGATSSSRAGGEATSSSRAGGGRVAGGLANAGISPRLLAGARPIGRGPRFTPPVAGPALGACRSPLGPRAGVHLEVFAANRVVIVAAGIGVRGPVRRREGRIVAARCFGAIVTVEPTGVLLVRPGSRLRLADAFRAWGQPLGVDSLASFAADSGRHVRVYVDGHPRRGAPGEVPLTRHAEIVLEVGPYVPPHRTYLFPPGA